jgi:hypothetical protein
MAAAFVYRQRASSHAIINLDVGQATGRKYGPGEQEKAEQLQQALHGVLLSMRTPL